MDQEVYLANLKGQLHTVIEKLQYPNYDNQIIPLSKTLSSMQNMVDSDVIKSTQSFA